MNATADTNRAMLIDILPVLKGGDSNETKHVRHDSIH